MSRRGGTGLWRNESGATAALYALALPALVAVVGLGFDYAHLTALDTELQNAADQAALAGVTQLDRQSGAITRATSAAQGGLVENFTMMANDGKGSGIDVVTVSFYSTQAAAESCGNTGKINPAAANADTSAAFICVTVETRTANYALTPIAGALRGSTSAKAAAGVGSALCRTPPLMLCNPQEPTSGSASADFNANALAGVGLLVKGGGGNSWAPGNFGFLDTFPGSGGGANDLRKAFAWDTTPGNCIAQTGNTTVDTEPGNMTTVADAINMRFDVANTSCESGGTCSASINSVKDLVHPTSGGGQTCKAHNQGWQTVSGAYAANDKNNPLPATTTPTAMGHPRDICHAVSENGECPGGPFGNGVWDRNAYFRTNYPAWTNPDHSNRWQANTGLPSNATRYQVYRWEAEHAGQTIDGQQVLGTRTVSGSLAAYGQPRCLSPLNPTTGAVDRRRVSVAVVNCVANGVKGRTSGVPVRRWIDVFLVEPSWDRGNGSNKKSTKDQIYVEIIGETAAGSAGENAGTVIRRDVPYLLK